MAQPDPISLAVAGVDQLVSSRMNKVNMGAVGNAEGIAGPEVEELSVKLSDEELLQLARDWEQQYMGYESKIKAEGAINKTYYEGRQKDGTPSDVKDFPIAGNIIFEAEETFLAAAMAKNPEPVVYSDNTEEGNKLSDDIKTMLQYHADILGLRSKLKMMVRQWSIYQLAVIKHGWDEEIKDIKSEVRDVRNFIFDPKASVDVYGDMEGYVGERVTVKAHKLVDLFPKHAGYITLMVDGKMGTSVTYTEWWNDDYCFYTFRNKVLEKSKNPFFVYPKTTKGDAEQGIEDVIDEGNNHFSKPKKPYTFLSVFSLGEQPHDITGLIKQNIPNQNLITRRTIDIDRNLRRSNNSIGLSANNFNQQTGKQAAGALEAGDPVLIPPGADGKIENGIQRFPAPPIPDAFFKDLENNIERLRSSFGTNGISAQNPDEDTTARGMILSQSFDNSRIGGGIGEALAQVADNVFNYWVQMYHVFYDEPHYAAVIGALKSTEYIIISNQQFTHKLVVSVSADSMKPKDELTVMNQAMQLFSEGNLDPKTFFTVINFPNPEETAGQLMMYKLSPQTYMQLNFPDLAQQLQAQMQQGQQMQQAAQQQQMQAEAQGQQQQMQAKGASAAQDMAIKDATHKQKLTQADEIHRQKLEQMDSTAVSPASASLAKVKLPK